jgi:hypothetical protein
VQGMCPTWSWAPASVARWHSWQDGGSREEGHVLPYQVVKMKRIENAEN